MKTINHPFYGTIPVIGPKSYDFYLSTNDTHNLTMRDPNNPCVNVHAEWLEPNHYVTNQKSFYKRAYVVTDTSELHPIHVLYSYGTPVAAICCGELIRLWSDWSATTAKHFQSFFGTKLSKKEWMDMEVQSMHYVRQRARDAH